MVLPKGKFNMNNHRFAANPLRHAVSTAFAPGQSFTKPIKQTAAALLAVSTIGMTSGAAIAAESGVLEEVIVTATRREASLQDVAIPMTAVSGEALKRAFAQDLRDLTDAAPNVQFEPVGIFQNASSFFIRGQGTGDIESASDGKVGVYVDGVVQARVSTALSDMVDVSSVEILRGPQGTLFGRNTIAGAVQMLHNRPQFNEWGGNISAQVGDFGRFDVKGVVNVPMIDDKLAGRLAFKSTNHDGYWKNSAVGKDRGKQDRLTILPSLKWNASEKLDITVRGEWSKTRDDTNMTQSHHYCRNDPFNLFTGGPLDNDLVITTETLYNLIVLGQDPVTAAAGAASICAKPLGKGSVDDEWTAPNTEDRGQQYDTDVWGITLQADYELGELGSLTYIGNYRDVEEDIIFTIDVSNHDLFAGQRITDHDQMSHEVRFASDFSDKFDFVAGAYYFEQEYAMKQSSFGMLFAPNIVLNAPDPTAITFTHPETFGQAQFSNQDNKAWALFTQANWHVTDALTVTAGGRYTSETKKFKHCIGVGDDALGVSAAKNAEGCNHSQAYVIDPTLPPIAPPETGSAIPTPVWQLVPAIGFDTGGGAENGCRPVLDAAGGPIFCNNRMSPPKEKWTDFTPMAGVSYAFTDDMMAYFTWTKGFTAGGFNGRGVTESTIGPFDPEEAENFELGLKSDWFDHRLRFNMTAFDTEVKDFQAAFIRPAPGGGGQETIQANLGSFETEGLEFELTALPTPELTVWLNVSHLKTERLGFCTDPDGPHGVAGVVPTEGGPLSGEAPLCGTPTSLTNSIGEFVGWNVPVDASLFTGRGRAPRWTTSAGFAYTFNLADLGNLTVSADWQYQARQSVAGSRISEPDGVQQFNGDFITHSRGATDIYNASAIWRSVEETYEVAFFMKNLTNELYNQATTNVGGLLNFRNTNIRRHWAVEFRANLGSS
jgi:iron complex outermembrane receptor protein